MNPNPHRGHPKSPDQRAQIGRFHHKRHAAMSEQEKKELRAKARAAHAERRKLIPLTLRELGVPSPMVVDAPELSKLNVDERYQRIRITNMVSRLIHVLQNGGAIPDPVTLARRRDKSLWIVDGQQRFWAHSELGRPLRALVYDVNDFDQERKLFLVLNTKVNVNADTIVKSWSGPVGELLRELDQEGTPYYGHVDWGYTHGRPYGAAGLARMILIVTTNTRATGAMTEILPRADLALAEPAALDRARALLRLIPLVWQPQPRRIRGHVRTLHLEALARIAFERWGTRVTFPAPTVYRRLERMNWEDAVPGYAPKYLPVLLEMVRKRWPA